MAAKTIDAELLAKMFLAGAKYLENNKDYINELNVFPVPDGDTGTNMTLTILSAAKELNSVTEKNMQTVCKAVSSGSLRGARGNSGVILSQLIRGFTKVSSNYEELDADILDEAFQRAVKTAYKAVMKPKEGTILTVAAGVAKKSEDLRRSGVSELDVFLKEIVEEADRVLQTTPDLQPVLKEAGVVASCGHIGPFAVALESVGIRYARSFLQHLLYLEAYARASPEVELICGISFDGVTRIFTRIGIYFRIRIDSIFRTYIHKVFHVLWIFGGLGGPVVKSVKIVVYVERNAAIQVFRRHV